MLDLPAGVSDLQRQSIASPINHKKLSNLQFHLLRAALNSLLRPHHHSSNIHHTLIGYGRHILKHLLRDCLRFEGTGLQGGVILSEHDEAIVALASSVVHPGSDEHLLPLEGVIDICQSQPLPA